MQPDGSIKEFDQSGEWRHITVVDAVAEKLGEQITADTPIE
jgi:lysyl-tRNA synthetase class 2